MRGVRGVVAALTLRVVWVLRCVGVSMWVCGCRCV